MNANLGLVGMAPRPTAAQAGTARRGGALAALALLLCCVPFAGASAQATNRLEAVDVATLPGQQVQLRLRTSGPAPQPVSFTIDRPARISLDLPGVGLALAQRRIDVKSGGLDSIVAGEGGGRTRIVLNMDALVPYDTRVEDNAIVVTLGQAPVGGAPGVPLVAGQAGGNSPAAPARSAASGVSRRSTSAARPTAPAA